MTTFGNGFTRRDALRLAGAGAGATLLPGLGGSAAFAQGQTLRAAISGFNVINTLDPMKGSLISE